MISVSEPASGSEPVAAVYDRRNDPVSPLSSVGGHRPPLQVQSIQTKTKPDILLSIGGHKPPLPVLLPLHLQTPCAGC